MVNGLKLKEPDWFRPWSSLVMSHQSTHVCMYLLSRLSIPIRTAPNLRIAYSSRSRMSFTPAYKYISAEVREL